MNAAFVCLRCARRIAANGPRAGQQLAFRGSKASIAASVGRWQSTSASTPSGNETSVLQDPWETPDTASSTVIRRVTVSSRSPPSSQPGPRTPTSYEAHQIQDLVRPERSALEIWHRMMALHAFSASALPQSLEIGLQRSPEIHKAFRLFVHTALHEPQPDFPSLETIMRKFLERGLFRYQMLADVLQEARPALANAVFGKHETQEVEDARALELLRNIVVAWRLTLGQSTAKVLLAGQQENNDWDGLPKPDEVLEQRTTNKSYMSLFSDLFSGRLNVREEQRVAADSAWAFVCMEELKRRDRLPENLQEEWKPWTELMWPLLSHTRISPSSQIRNILSVVTHKASETILRAAVDSWHIDYRADASASPTEHHPHLGPGKSSQYNETTPFEGSDEAWAWRSKIRRAVEKKQERPLIATWLEFKETSKAWTNRDDAAAVVGEFLWACARLNMREMMIGVWRFLQEEKLTPTLTHWTAMLQATKRTGDRDSAPKIWEAMIRTGYRPPNQLWTTYITTLLHVRHRRLALQAVYEMSEQWRALAGKGSSDGDPLSADFQPSMIPINAALSGLIGMERSEAIPALLKTAEEHGLAPEIDTFNILLRSAVHKKDHVGTRAVLAEIKASGCEPDVVTITTYLDGLLKDPASPFHTGAAEEAQAAITQLFADISAAGLRPSPLTYTTLLHNLLQGESPNVPAVQAVLHEMDVQGVQPSSHAYTILVRHYFQRTPPDLAAVERLRARIDAEGTTLDLRFYDGLVQGYARVGERDRMLSVLRRMRNPDQLRLWTLNEALALCEQDGDAESARDLVQQTVRRLGSATLSKGERQKIPRWRELVARLKDAGVIEHMPQPTMFRKIE